MAYVLIFLTIISNPNPPPCVFAYNSLPDFKLYWHLFFTEFDTLIQIWVFVEMTVSIIAACLPTMAPLFTGWPQPMPDSPSRYHTSHHVSIVVSSGVLVMKEVKAAAYRLASFNAQTVLKRSRKAFQRMTILGTSPRREIQVWEI